MGIMAIMTSSAGWNSTRWTPKACFRPAVERACACAALSTILLLAKIVPGPDACVLRGDWHLYSQIVCLRSAAANGDERLARLQRRHLVPAVEAVSGVGASGLKQVRLFPKPPLLKGVRARALHLAGTITAAVGGTLMDETTTQETTMMVKKAKPKPNPRWNSVDEVGERVVAV
jgi:hypothetical protein